MTDKTTNLQQYEEKIGHIRRNPDLNQEAKRRMIREIHEKAAKEHRRLVAEAREAREQAVKSAERMVLPSPTPSVPLQARRRLSPSATATPETGPNVQRQTGITRTPSRTFWTAPRRRATPSSQRPPITPPP